jgi:signal transduction histidine kinase
MTTNDEALSALDAALADPTASEERVRDAVSACTDCLRDGGVEEDPFAIGDKLLPLVTHPSAKVRQAVADACEHLPEAMCDRALETLFVDRDGYVRRAAQRSAERRAVRRKKRKKDDGASRELAFIYEAIGKKSKSAKKLAERAVALEREALVAKLNHEVSKIVTPLQQAIHELGQEAKKEHVDRGALARSVEIARERLAFLWSIHVSARAMTATVTPEFRRENVAKLVDEGAAQLVERLGGASGAGRGVNGAGGAETRGARVRLRNEVDAELVIDAHRHSLMQALQNMLQNAAEAYEGGAGEIPIHVTAKTLRGGTLVEIAVRDEGVGMSDVQRENVFVPFLTSKVGGTGVGMLIARKMVEEVHGGTVSVESERGRGTTVVVTLPVKHMTTARAR